MIKTDKDSGQRSTRAVSVHKLVPLNGLRVIDLGSHQGHNSFDLADYGAREVVGVEIRDRYLSVANTLKREQGYNNVFFVKHDVRFIDQANLEIFDMCLCTGLLYHMQNPFNLLKRIRNICKTLMLETHIAPSSMLRYFRTGRSYRKHLTLWRYRILLDGESFYGRLKIHRKNVDMTETSGSIVSRATFWMERESLLKALTLSGFEIKAIYYDRIPNHFPDIKIKYGLYKTKIFIYALVREPRKFIPVQESEVQGHKLLVEASL